MTSISARARSGAAPIKGERLVLELTIENTGPGVARARLTPLLDSKRFGDYGAVPLATQEVTLCAGSQHASQHRGRPRALHWN